MIINGDCLEEMRKMEANSISAIVTDPPYMIGFMNKEFDKFKDNPAAKVELWEEAFRVCKPGAHLLAFGGDRTHHHLMLALENAGWTIRTCLYWITGQGFPKSHNFGCKCRGVPLPCSHEKETESISESLLRSMSKADLSTEINSSDKSQKVLFDGLSEQGLSSHGTTPRIWYETGKEPCLERRSDLQEEQRELSRPQICALSTGISSDGKERRVCDGTSSGDGAISQADAFENGSSASQRSQHEEQQHRKPGTVSRQRHPQKSGMGTCEKCGGLLDFKGYGTALKPAAEIIIMAMKPCEGTFAQNAEKWGVAGINVDASRIESGKDYEINCTRENVKSHWGNSKSNSSVNASPNGRWPANLILDEEAGEMLDEMSGYLKSGALSEIKSPKQNEIYGKYAYANLNEFPSNSGGASRFFYCAKASSAERNRGCKGLPTGQTMGGGGTNNTNDDVCGKYGSIKAAQKNIHPTVKPLKLMEYLIRLIAPPKDAVILDPFAGSGTTLLACQNLGVTCIGIEKSAEYCAIAQARIDANANLFSKTR